MTWTMPCVSLPNAWIGMPNSRQLTSSWLICAAACMSIIGRPRGVVGVEWSAVATVLSGRRTARPRVRSPVKAWGLVTSWTRWRSTARIAGAPGSSATTCVSQIFSTSVRGLAVAISAGDVLCGGVPGCKGSSAWRDARPAARRSGPGPTRYFRVTVRVGTRSVEQAQSVTSALRASPDGVRDARRGPRRPRGAPQASRRRTRDRRSDRRGPQAGAPGPGAGPDRPVQRPAGGPRGAPVRRSSCAARPRSSRPSSSRGTSWRRRSSRPSSRSSTSTSGARSTRSR